MRKPHRKNGRFVAANATDNSRASDANNGAAIGGDNGSVDAAIIFDPSEFAGGATEAVGQSEQPASGEPGQPEKRGRGRPKGSKNGQRQTAQGQVNISGVEKLLLGIHNTLAASLSIPELEMEIDEARDLAKAYADVAEYYPVLKMNGETAAVVTLTSLISVNYGARLMAYRLRRSAEKKGNAARTINQPSVTPTGENGQRTTPIPPNIFNAAPPAPSASPMPQEKPVLTSEMRKGEVPGVGTIEFPPDHPLMMGRKMN